MTGGAVADGPLKGTKQTAVLVLVGAGLVACVAIAALEAHHDHVGVLTIVLGLASVVAGIVVVPSQGRASVTPSLIVVTLASALLGPASAVAMVLTGEVAAARRLRTPVVAAVFNVFAGMAPTLVGASVIVWLHPSHRASLLFYVLVAVAGAIILTLNFALIALVYFPVFRGVRPLNLRTFWNYTPTQSLNIALAVAGAGIYVKVGLVGIVFALLALFSFAYMAHLLEQSRQRAEQYMSLSWGVLGGLMRAMDTRDGRAARHAAAVAAFARDMAKELKMSEREQELSHTAGLLHDIGHFALSDAVHERGRTLNNKDWEDIYRHPEVGADMLKDLGIYGPVAEIVLCHHERVDGFGYPRGLPGEEIPEIAKIIAVAEVYDTLTAKDTYRTQMSSFEALTELRRVAGSQLDADYVEVLARLLSGEGVEYRHANAADFDRELDMERRIRQARAS